jgi:hypothetical protein
VLDEHQVPEMLEQVGDQPPEIVALLGELLQEDERARRVPVDDEVAQAEGTRPRPSRAAAASWTLIVLPVAEASWSVSTRRRGTPRPPRADQGEGRIGHLHPLAVGDPTQLPARVGQPRPRWSRTSGGATTQSPARLQLGRAEDEEQVRRGLLDPASAAFQAGSVS